MRCFLDVQEAPSKKIRPAIGNPDHLSINRFLTKSSQTTLQKQHWKDFAHYLHISIARRGTILDNSKPVRDESVHVFDVAEQSCAICPKHRMADQNLQFFSKHIAQLDSKGCGSYNYSRGTDSDLRGAKWCNILAQVQLGGITTQAPIWLVQHNSLFPKHLG